MPNLSYHSVNPVSLPSQAHQISSSSSLASVAVIETGLVGRDMLFSGLVWQPMRTPSVLTPAAPRGRGLPSFPIVDSALTRPESTRKSRNIASMDLQTFCRGSHVGCEKRRGARSSMCVCVGATISHKLVDRLISKSWCEQNVHRGLTGALTYLSCHPTAFGVCVHKRACEQAFRGAQSLLPFGMCTCRLRCEVRLRGAAARR